MDEVINPLRKYLRKDSLPHFFCAGCGAAQVLNFFVQAADAINLDFDNLVTIGGVGCTARIPVYLGYGNSSWNSWADTSMGNRHQASQSKIKSSDLRG